MVLGSLVAVDDPMNLQNVSQLQCRNMRISVRNQKAVISFELFDVGQPVEQHNANIQIPIKIRVDDEEEDIKKILPNVNSVDISHIQKSKADLMPSIKWAEDTQQTQVARTTVPSMTYGRVNYLTGIPINE